MLHDETVAVVSTIVPSIRYLMRIGPGGRHVDDDGDHRIGQWDMADAKSYDYWFDVLLQHLFKPDFGVKLSIYSIVEAGRLVVFLRHAVDDLTTIGICESGDIPASFPASSHRPSCRWLEKLCIRAICSPSRFPCEALPSQLCF